MAATLSENPNLILRDQNSLKAVRRNPSELGDGTNQNTRPRRPHNGRAPTPPRAVIPREIGDSRTEYHNGG